MCIALAAAMFLAAEMCAASPGEPPKPARRGATTSRAVEWTSYANDAGGSKYSAAAQITRDNVSQLVPAWTYRTGDYGIGTALVRDETTPLFVDGVLYASTPFGGVRALDGASGRELWAFDSELDLEGDYGDFTNRGVSTWLDPSRSRDAKCRRRIFVAPVDARLIALDARTGAPCADFGEKGQVHLDRGLRNEPKYRGEYAITSPPTVVGELVIVGSSISDNQRAMAPEGVVRAFDVRTGALRWAWDPIARTPSEPGYDTWRGPIAHATGAANAWAVISADSARDLIFVPVGSASPDFYGGERLGQNLFANSVVALRASTGKLVWHFQAVHHDLWDYDVPAQPVLFTLRRDGRDIPALAQATKMGFLFILDRETGEPLFPVQEHRVAASDVPGEDAWPTQPMPVVPRPLVPITLTPDDAFGISAESRTWCHDRIASLRSEGIFTPPSLRGSILYPGNIGGSNWGGASIDPVRHLAFLPLNRLATVVQLIPRDDYRAEMARTGRDFQIAPQAGTAFAMRRQTPLAAPDHVPCTPPPYGTLTAVNLESGQVQWEVPFGRIEALSAIPGSERWGSPSLGGALTTAGGIVFAGGALDRRLHAFDEETGRELGSWELAAGVHAAPMTYVTETGRQFVVAAAGGHKDLRTAPGDYIVAFALPTTIASNARARPAEPRSGKYEGHMIFDRTRAPATWKLRVSGGTAQVEMETRQLHVTGTGRGTIEGGALVVDLAWRYPAGHCSGTMHLTGKSANDGAALIGEISYRDGCDGDREKSGTFALWRGRRTTTRLPNS
ncbi:MAG TPA: pyrroloquinoline quinone-dependent dehydrogenase [Casimicrobiaceae bacterium]|nr:pyrroloquinoline quinone-dependent dehydrogenase [Casimicrobiaceae bacterium]